jgi:hypothetical protein
MLHLISDLHAELPDELKRVKAITGDPQSDRYGLIGMAPLTLLHV